MRGIQLCAAPEGLVWFLSDCSKGVDFDHFDLK